MNDGTLSAALTAAVLLASQIAAEFQRFGLDGVIDFIAALVPNF